MRSDSINITPTSPSIRHLVGYARFQVTDMNAKSKSITSGDDNMGSKDIEAGSISSRFIPNNLS